MLASTLLLLGHVRVLLQLMILRDINHGSESGHVMSKTFGDRRAGFDNFKKESNASRDKAGKSSAQEGFQPEEDRAAEEAQTDTGEVPRSLTMIKVEDHTAEAEFSQDLGRGLVGETSGSSRDFVVDENANNYLVKEESQILRADRGLVESNRQENEGLIQERIDRFFYSLEWKDLFGDASVRVVDHWGSDHKPIVIENVVTSSGSFRDKKMG
ncbi:hypothetical protein ACOSQ2_027211 [Xanthoceras sorbifolium]